MNNKENHDYLKNHSSMQYTFDLYWMLSLIPNHKHIALKNNVVDRNYWLFSMKYIPRWNELRRNYSPKLLKLLLQKYSISIFIVNISSNTNNQNYRNKFELFQQKKLSK